MIGQPPEGTASADRASSRAAWLWRGLALVAALAVVVYPLRAFVTTAEVPIAVRAAVALVAAAAWLSPQASLLAFLIGAPLLPILPSRLGYPPLSLAEPWLLTLVAVAWVRYAAAPAPLRPRLPDSVWWLGALVTASLLVTMYPFHLARGGVSGLLVSIDVFLRDELLAATQRHPYWPIVAWGIVMEGLGLLWLVVRVFGGVADGPRRVARASAVGAALVALLGIRQWWTGEGLLQFWIFSDPGLTRVNASFSDVNGLGAYLALGLGVAAACALTAAPRSFERRAWLASAVVMSVCCLFTGSRAAWAAVIVTGPAAFLVLLRWSPALSAMQVRRLTRAFALTVLLGLVSVAGLSVYATSRNVGAFDRQDYFDAVLHTLNLNASLDDRLKGRLPYWEAGAAMVRAEPAFGIGIGRFYRQIWAFSPRQEALRRPQENAHNYYLQVAAELGLAGLVAFLALLGAVLRAAWRAGRDGSSPADRGFAVALGAGVTAYLLTLVTGHPLIVRDGQMAFWPIAGALWIAGGRPPSGVRRWPAWVAMAGVVAVLATVPFRAVRAADRVDVVATWFGLHGPETMPDGTRFRWSMGRFGVALPGTEESFSVDVLGVTPFSQRLRVHLDGRLVDEIDVVRARWQTLRYPLRSDDRGPRVRRIEIEVDPPWHPPRDDRELGVLVRDDDSMP